MYKGETLWVRAVSVSLLVLGLVACAPELEESQSDQTDDYINFESYVYVEADGTAYRNYWLEMEQFGEWERMGLVFGWVDDRTVCEEWADWLSQEYNLREYRCVEAEARDGGREAD